MQIAARNTDPITSHIAAEVNVMSGRRKAQQALTVAAVLAYPGSTSRELHEITGIDRHVLARRLPELERRGMIKRGVSRICKYGIGPAVTWWGPDHVVQMVLVA